nr:contactin-5-like [Pocillopora verrucosa]
MEEEGVIALKPKVSVVDKAVVAQKGSTETLICSATRVRKLTTSSSWEFNGQEIKKRNNKIIIPKPHYQTNKKKGNFTLTIKNVSETDVGTYTCKVSKINLDEMLEAKENIELSIQEEILNVTSTQTNIALDEGSTITLTCSVIFSEAFAVVVYWLLNGKIASKPEVLHQELNGMSMANKVKRLSITLELKHVTLAQSGIYTCGANSTIDLKTHDIAVNIRDTQGPDLNARAYD